MQIAPAFYPVPPKQYGGIERSIFDLTEELVKLGHEVYLYALKGSRSSATIIPYEHDGFNDTEIANFVIQTLREDIDVIHDHTHHSVVGKLKLSVPTVCSIRIPINNGVEHPIYLSVRALEQYGENKGTYVYNGVNPQDYQFSDQKQNYLLFLGIVGWHKGVHHAMEIAVKTKNKLIIAGPIWDKDFYSKHVVPEINNHPDLSYIGEVGGQERQYLLKNAKCVIFPTLCDEPFGRVMIESMACGTPVIALPNGSVPEVLAGFPNLICDTVDEMVQKVEKDSYPPPSELREYVQKHFSASLMASRYLETYKSVIELKR
ncbi:glycosyltransferase [Paenibacillus sedimenti]|uniref:glycosyltransferase n=1 Tax=Paenibacillus sedimenti TaxID=2770274 RepID=UPI0028A0933B|nr:glycosyltransferase [Paenibacillus sedimenti]